MKLRKSVEYEMEIKNVEWMWYRENYENDESEFNQPNWKWFHNICKKIRVWPGLPSFFSFWYILMDEYLYSRSQNVRM